MPDDLQTMAGGDGVSVHTGFPNPALEHRQQGLRLGLDINQLLIRHPSSTYLFRIAGHRWSDQGIYDGDIAVIDRAVSRGAGDLVLHWQDDNFTLQRLRDIEDKDEAWGVVTSVIHQFERENEQ